MITLLVFMRTQHTVLPVIVGKQEALNTKDVVYVLFMLSLPFFFLFYFNFKVAARFPNTVYQTIQRGNKTI